MNKNYDMRIANRAPKSKNGCYPFSEESILNIPDIDIFIEDDINNKIKLACQDVLRRSMQASNKYRYGEMGILISIYDDSVCARFNGEYNQVKVRNTIYDSMVSSRKAKDLIFIHNHPNNSNLSCGDLLNLVNTESLYAVVAIGNRSNIFIVTKEDELLASKFEKYVIIESNKMLQADKVKRPIKYYRDTISKNILENNPETFGLDYIKLRRNSK